jgi:hypothetical protein
MTIDDAVGIGPGRHRGNVHLEGIEVGEPLGEHLRRRRLTDPKHDLGNVRGHEVGAAEDVVERSNRNRWPPRLHAPETATDIGEHRPAERPGQPSDLRGLLATAAEHHHTLLADDPRGEIGDRVGMGRDL